MRPGSTSLALALSLCALLGTGAAGCRDWKAKVDPARARAEPVQEALEGARPIEYEKRGFRVRLVPRATCQVTGYAVEKSTELLDEWDFNSTLLTFFKGIESLLSNPNPANPYGTDSCTRAAEYFNKHPYKPPEIVQSAKKEPRILGDSTDAERPAPPGE